AALLDLGELDAARADVEDQVATLTAKGVLNLRRQYPLDKRMTRQTFAERQGVVLLISLPPPCRARRRVALNCRNQAEKPAGVCAGATGLSKHVGSKLRI